MFLPTPILSLLLLALTTTTTLAASLPLSTSIFYWPLTSSSPTLLAEISYDPTTLTTAIDSYHPPSPETKEQDSEAPIRIGLYNKSQKEWTGTLTSLSSLPSSNGASSSTTTNATITLHLNPHNANEIYHVSLFPSSSSDSTTDSKTSDSPLKVSLLRPTQGPTPQLAKPIAPRADGGDGQGEEGEEEQKSIFQR